MRNFLYLGLIAILLATLPVNAQELSSGSPSLEAVSGVDQLSLATENVILRFDVSLEPLARELLPRIDALIEKLETRLKFKLKNPMPLYLVSRGFGNAYVMGPYIAAPAYSVVPGTLTSAEIGSPIFSYAGFEEDSFDVFAHELMHYIEVDQEIPAWGVVFGEGAYNLPDNSSWMSEGWAVIHESRAAFLKGRMKKSLFGALLESNLSERDDGKLTGWDLSRNNPEWKFVGSMYVTGASFLDFLARKYGRNKVDELMLSRHPFSPTSAYTEVFGKSFSTLLEEFNSELTRERENSKTRRLAPTLFEGDLGLVGDIGVTQQGDLVFLGSGLSQNSKIYRLSQEGLPKDKAAFFEWFSPISGNLSSAPLEWSAQSGTETLDYFAAQESPANNEAIPGIYRYDMRDHTRRLMRSLPLARTAVVLPDGDTFYVLRQVDRNKSVFALEQGKLSNAQLPNTELTRIETLKSVSMLTWNEQNKVLTFAGIEAGGSWAVYQTSAVPGSKPERMIDTNGQDLYPASTPEGLVFLSDLDDTRFQVYRLKGQELCPLSDEPYFVRSFKPLADGGFVAVSRRGTREILVRLTGEPVGPCRDLKRFNAPRTQPETFEASTNTAFRESSRSAFIPNTRILIPSYYKSYGLGLQALLAGESPYKDWSWSLLGDLDTKNKDAYVVAGTVGFRQAYPWLSRVTLESSTRAIGRGGPYEDTRYLTTAYVGSYIASNHTYQLQLLSSLQTATDVPLYKDKGAFSMGVRHTFSNTQSVALAAGPQRGLVLSEAYQLSPSYFGTILEPKILDLRQRIYVPLVASIFPTHSLSIQLTQSFSSDTYLFLTGSGGRGRIFSYSASNEYTQDPHLSPLAGNHQDIYGYPGFLASGDKLFTQSVYYALPLNFMQYGLSTLFGRRWLNPESSQMTLTLFYESMRVSGYDLEERLEGSTFLSSTGFVTTWSLWMSESQNTGISASYIFAKELGREKNTTSLLSTSARIVF